MEENKVPFSASVRELLAALCVYVLAYIYHDVLFSADTSDPVFLISLAVFVVGFAGVGEWLLWERKRKPESWLWLGCTALILLTMLLRREEDSGVFTPGQSALLLHAYAVYWLLCRADLLHGGESSTLLPLDGLFGFFVLPFGSFGLRLRTLGWGLRSLRKERKKTDPVTVFTICIVLLLALALLVLAGQFLSGADADFAKLLDSLRLEFRPDDSWRSFCWRLVFSLPVGAYLFGLLDGCRRASPEAFRTRGEDTKKELAAVRRVPGGIFTAVLAAFSVLYLTFFAVQFRYLFGAFTRTLPEGFIVSEYARQGFFELCKVMAVNFAILWLVTRCSAARPEESRLLRILCTALLVQSMVFAVIAFSKLALYISCFGFTPKRLQSSWLVVVLFFGCLCAMDSLLRGKKRFRLWMDFSGVTLALLHLFGLF